MSSHFCEKKEDILVINYSKTKKSWSLICFKSLFSFYEICNNEIHDCDYCWDLSIRQVRSSLSLKMSREETCSLYLLIFSEFRDQILLIHALLIHSSIDSNHLVFSFFLRFSCIYNLLNLSVLLKIFHRFDEILMSISLKFEISLRSQSFAHIYFIYFVDILISRQIYRLATRWRSL